MKRLCLFFTAVCALGHDVFCQESPFPFGKITYQELEMKSYPSDTSANAVVLREMGETYISNEGDNNLIYEYHAKIKILRKSGYRYATFAIPLYKSMEGSQEERWISLQASTFNDENNSIKETKFDNKDFFLEKNGDRYFNRARFALPDVHEGSVIEIKYVIESPFIFNWHTWEFQSDIPKVKSDFWAKIPANYVYNVTLRGFLTLASNEATAVKDCFTPGGGMSAGCSFLKYSMVDIPAFVEEDYMTAKSNFLSAINFELSEVKRFDGVTKKYTEEWKDVDSRLREDNRFGAQIRKARNMLDEKVLPLVANEPDTLARAGAIYDYIKGWYTWNENNSKYSELEIKKAFDSRTGNVADINLSLVGALQSAGVNASPVMLSTRANGLPVEIHPVLSDFNYVIAHVKYNGQVYLLDATEKYLPFGMLPVRCLNGKGRLISKKESGWVELKTKEKQKTATFVQLKLTDDGSLSGKMTINSYGYEAADVREDYEAAGGEAEYFKTWKEKYKEVSFANYTVENITDLTKPVAEKMDIEIPDVNSTNASVFYFNPFLFSQWHKNPFKSNERLYPVDLGAPMDINVVMTLELPADYIVEESPASLAIALPQGGGRALINVSNQGNTINLSCAITLNKAIYNSEEYHYLKEFFARVIQAQQSMFVFKKK